MPRFANPLAAALVSLATLTSAAALAAQSPVQTATTSSSPAVNAAPSDAAARPTLLVSPAVGSLVRVTLPAPSANAPRRRHLGTVIMLERDSMRVYWRDGDSSTTIALADVQRLEVSLGRHRRVLRSIGMGTVISAGGFALLTALTHGDSCPSTGCDWFYLSRGEAATLAGIMGAIGGAVVGGIVGAVRTSERWHTLTRGDVTARLAITPQLGRSNGVHVRVAF